MYQLILIVTPNLNTTQLYACTLSFYNVDWYGDQVLATGEIEYDEFTFKQIQLLATERFL